MGIFDKISNLIFEEEPNDKKTTSAPEKKGKWSDIFFEEVSEETGSEKKKKRFSDIFFEEVQEDDEIKSTFVVGDEKTSVLNDIASQIERRESELINLSEFFKTVNPKEFPDSLSEYEAYISLVKQLNSIKALSEPGQNGATASMNSYQLESSFRKFEADYKAHINAIQSLCYLSEISTINAQMQTMFSSHFTRRTEEKIDQTEGYVTLISQKSSKFDKKYSGRLYKELIEAEYRLTLLKLMVELKNGRNPRRNPFSSFAPQKKKTFETYLSKDLRDSNAKYNSIADNREKYTRYGLVEADFFDKLDSDAEVIAERINKYTIDDFLLNELLENGDGFESLKRFLAFKLNLNYIDSKTQEADTRFLDDSYRKATAGHAVNPRKKSSSGYGSKSSKSSRKFPSYEDDL